METLMHINDFSEEKKKKQTCTFKKDCILSLLILLYTITKACFSF